MNHLVIPKQTHVWQYFVLILGVVREYSYIRNNIFKWASIKKCLTIGAKTVIYYTSYIYNIYIYLLY
jgi:hypothetical protein